MNFRPNSHHGIISIKHNLDTLSAAPTIYRGFPYHMFWYGKSKQYFDMLALTIEIIFTGNTLKKKFVTCLDYGYLLHSSGSWQNILLFIRLLWLNLKSFNHYVLNMNPRIFLICLFKFLNPNMKGSYDITAIVLDFTAYIRHLLLSIFSSFPLGRGIGIFFTQTQTSIHKDTLY